MLKSFIKFITHNQLFLKGEKILLGVSGGVDSMVLCDLFLKSGFKFAIAHCNFHLRDRESDGDEKLVAAFAERNQIQYHVAHFDTVVYATESHLSIQMAARELRYNWFMELQREFDYDKTAVAHHADDNIETFFLNLTRGAGLNGLCGMPVVNGTIIRPLLFATRDEIMRYAKENSVVYREDSSNAQSKYARNRIRLNVIPELEKINPSFKRTMQEDLTKLSEIRDFTYTIMSRIAAGVCIFKGNVIWIDIEKLKKLDFRDLFLYYLLNQYGFKNEIIKQISASLTASSGKYFISDTHIIVKDREYLILAPKTLDDSDEYVIEKNTSEIFIPIHLLFDVIEKNSKFEIIKNKIVAQLDYDKLKFPLVLRKWRNGDSFVPFGMVGRKKLSDYFSDHKFSLLDKQNQWVLTSGNDIIWLVGERTDNRYKITAKTRHILKIQFITE